MIPTHSCEKEITYIANFNVLMQTSSNVENI